MSNPEVTENSEEGAFKKKINLSEALELTGSAVRFPEQFADTHLYSWVEKGTVRAQKQRCPQIGSKPDCLIWAQVH